MAVIQSPAPNQIQNPSPAAARANQTAPAPASQPAQPRSNRAAAPAPAAVSSATANSTASATSSLQRPLSGTSIHSKPLRSPKQTLVVEDLDPASDVEFSSDSIPQAPIPSQKNEIA